MTVYRCKEPFAYVDADGTPVSVGLGDIMVSSHPEFEKRARLFEAIVEEATAEPGMLRSLGRRGPGRPKKEPDPEPEPEPKSVPKSESSKE